MERCAYSLGFFLGDGNLNAGADGTRQVRFYKPDKEPLERVAREVLEVFGRSYAVAEDKSKHVKSDYWRLQLTHPMIFDFFVVNTRYRQEVPHEFFGAASPVQLALLAGLIDSDGFVSIASRGGERMQEMRCQMGFSNTNRHLVEQFAELGAAAGIKIQPVRESPPRIAHWKTLYGVTVNIRSAWLAGLRLTSARKQRKLEQAVVMLSASETMYAPAPT
jgi:hypothetical protein